MLLGGTCVWISHTTPSLGTSLYSYLSLLTTNAWRQRRNVLLGAENLGDPASQSTLPTDKRQKLLNAFFERYRFHLQLENQPSDNTLHLLVKLHSRRAADFVSLARVTNLADGRDIRAEPHTRAKLGKDVAIVLENATSRKQSDFNSTPDAFVHAVRVLMFGYALVSAGDPAADTWCDLDASFSHMSRVEQLVKLDSKSNHNMHSRLMDSEMQIRAEWARIAQNSPLLSLGEIIAIVSQRHTFWPWVAEFRTTKPNRENKKPYDKFSRQNDWKDKGAKDALM